MNPEEKERIKRLVRELSKSVNDVLSESSDFKHAVRNIEEEGYEVDLLFALFTRILRRKGVDSDDEFLEGLGLKMPND